VADYIGKKSRSKAGNLTQPTSTQQRPEQESAAYSWPAADNAPDGSGQDIAASTTTSTRETFTQQTNTPSVNTSLETFSITVPKELMTQIKMAVD
jgi:hypothetical protein